jgi:hypothetical protein
LKDYRLRRVIGFRRLRDGVGNGEVRMNK